VNGSQKSRPERDDLTGEHSFGDAGQAIIAVVFIVVWLLDSFILHFSTASIRVLPVWVRVLLGAGLATVSGVFAWSTTRTVFGEVREPPIVIRSGLYRYMRHPMYFSEVILYVGLLCFSFSFAALAVLIIAIVFFTFLCRHEETLLVQRFGDDYREYMNDVPMWIPRFFKRRRR
jgi:protein-S-isoprenylcysteine O-methyltransferase Ste14